LEITLPHVVVRICGSGVGPDLVAALGLHPVEVTEARDASEARRVAGGRPAVLVVVTDPPDARAPTAETWSVFPKTPILIVAPAARGAAAQQPALGPQAGDKGWVDSIPGDLPLADICWHVMEALSRANRLTSVLDPPIGPVSIDVDDQGRVTAGGDCVEGVLINGQRLMAGKTILDLLAPADRPLLATSLRQAPLGEAWFSPMRLLDPRGGTHTVSIGTRHTAEGRRCLLIQPLVAGGPTVGRHVNNRDSVTGLLTRWGMARELESLARSNPEDPGAVILVLKLENFAAIGEYVGHAATDTLLVRVGSVLNCVLPYPALVSRVMGDTFHVCLTEGGIDAAVRSAERLIEGINGIDVPGFSSDFHLRAAVGIAAVSRKDFDFAIRLADSGVDAAAAEGGNRAVVVGTPSSGVVAHDLSAAMELGSWEVWLQPVVGQAGGHAPFHEALARFGNGRGRVMTRPDFFATGWGQGLLERFDLIMLQRVLEILASHPYARISVNVSRETFVSKAFPGSFLEPIRALPDGCERVILEISPHCLEMPTPAVKSRLESLAAAGVAVAVDDFGSGICQLRSLTQFPLAIVKLDQLATGYIDDDPLQREFVRVVVSICRARGMTTVAEYTRSPEQMARLIEDGVDWFQGELFGMPAPAAAVLAPPAVGASPA